MTIIERFRDPRGRTATISWACASSYQKPISAPQSLALLLPRFGINVRLVHPPEFGLMPDIVEQAKHEARLAHVSFEVSHDFDEGIKGTDVIYAKSWGALLTTTDEAEGARLIGKYPDWITDARRLATASDDGIFMHPLPADRNVEVSDEVIDGARSVVYDQAENRLHSQKAVMALTMR
jgi:N-acetylornithine carbamoyltransferase